MSAWTRLRDWWREPVDVSCDSVAPVTIDTPTDDDLRVLYEWLTVGDYWQVPPEMFAVRRLCFNGAPNHAFMVLRALVGAR